MDGLPSDRFMRALIGDVFMADYVPVLSRSEVLVEPHEYGFRYHFSIVLEDGEVLEFENYANTSDKAMTAGIRRSEKMIERGYQEGM